MIKGFIEVDVALCKGCELCIPACPPKVQCITMSNELEDVHPNTNAKGYHFVVQNIDTCTGCGNCAVVCPDSVITVYRLAREKKKK